MVFDEKIVEGEDLSEVTKDMNLIIEEVQLLLISAAMWTHADKMRLVKKFRKLRGIEE